MLAKQRQCERSMPASEQTIFGLQNGQVRCEVAFLFKSCVSLSARVSDLWPMMDVSGLMERVGWDDLGLQDDKKATNSTSDAGQSQKQ